MTDFMSAREEPSLKNLTHPNFGKPKASRNKLLHSLADAHISSFNFVLNEGLKMAVSNIPPSEFYVLDDVKFKIALTDCRISLPYSDREFTPLYPSECRIRGVGYKGPLHVEISFWIDGEGKEPVSFYLGDIPIMVKSKNCHLANLSPEELVKLGEEEDEFGGYFIVRGTEKLIRLLIVSRRNYPISVERNSWKARGRAFTEFGVMIRCVRNDEFTSNNTLHYLSDGTMKLMFSQNRVLYFPSLLLIMKALKQITDRDLFEDLTQGWKHNTRFQEYVLNMLRDIGGKGILSQVHAKRYIGRTFRSDFRNLPPWKTDEEVCDFLLRECVLVHLEDNEDKFNLLVLMAQKLMSMVVGESVAEGEDVTAMHEALLPGHIYLQVLTERLTQYINSRKWFLLKFLAKLKIDKNDIMKRDQIISREFTKALHTSHSTVEKGIEYFLATGSLSQNSMLNAKQTAGMSIVVENINRMRYMSHFRAIHRGAFFTTMRITTPRKLPPEAWGFICPVHTPDGTPCGLLNHLSMSCHVVTEACKEERILNQLYRSHIMIANCRENRFSCYRVVLNGKCVGYVLKKSAQEFVDTLREFKCNKQIFIYTEIAFIPIREGLAGQFPGIYIFTTTARLMRPVLNIKQFQMYGTGKVIEYIGTLEQVYLDVALNPEDIKPKISTHVELSETNFLSNLALLTPLPDFNQSPRNIYQCQMGKQTMGTATHNHRTHPLLKEYRLQTPTSPLFRPTHYDKLNMDNYPMGTNAIVAFISCTGYDMEDAMIISKFSAERGFAYGTVYSTQCIQLADLAPDRQAKSMENSYFCLDPDDEELKETLGEDGLPFVGAILQHKSPLYCYWNCVSNEYKVGRFKNEEEAYIDNVRLYSYQEMQAASITFRIPRAPTIGDKFASRSGQKGICSRLYPYEDLPFSDSGISPDIIFNPHGIPSRMTVAMLLEMMAGKAACSHGHVYDARPFLFTNELSAAEYFGHLLKTAGFNYYGTELMYSGISGQQMTAYLFVGMVHYQRLRHMVSDKWQVRAEGPIDKVTKQPVQGRKRGGGVRFGEMERDGLISHGASFALHDRFFHCCDKSKEWACTMCSSLASPRINAGVIKVDSAKPICCLCDSKDNVELIEIPYILKYLVTELLMVGIKLRLHFKTSQ